MVLKRVKKVKSSKKNKKTTKTSNKTAKPKNKIHNFVMSRWDGTHVNSTATFVSDSSSFRHGENGVLTGGEPDPTFPRIYLGWPQKNGSLTLDDFLLKKIWHSCDPIVGKLGLDTDYQFCNLHQVNLLQNIQDTVECAGGPYSTTELNDVSVCRMIKELYRNANVNDELPTFGDINNTIDLYASHSNGYWAMFYCEFFRLFNFMLKNSQYLNSLSLGFEWKEKVIGTLGFLFSDKNVKDTYFLKMSDSVICLIDKIVSLTPCMLEPIGLQHMMASNFKSIENLINDCVEFLNSKSCWLNRPVSLQHKVARKYWNIVRNIVLNLKGAIFNATCIMTCYSSLIEKSVGCVLQFDESTINQSMLEEPVLYGYKLRYSEYARNLIDYKYPGFGYTPFNFAKYVINLSDRTKGVSMYEYMPPFVSFYTTLQLLQENHFDVRLYSESYANAFGPRHSNVILSLVERSRHEWKKYSNKYTTDVNCLTELTIEKYPPLLSIMLRIAKLKEGLNEKNSTTDLHIQDDDKELTFALWCTHVIEQSYDSKVKMTKNIRNIYQDEKFWKPYNTKEPANISSEIILIKKNIAKLAACAAKNKFFLKWSGFVQKKLIYETKRKFIIFLQLKELTHASLIIQKQWCLFKKIKELKKRKIAKFQTLNEKELIFKKEIKEQEKSRLNQEYTYLHYREANLNELRRRLEYYVIHNIFNDPYLMSFRRPDGSFPYDVFLTFPSLQPIIFSIGEPIQALSEAANRSCQIHAVYHGIKPILY